MPTISNRKIITTCTRDCPSTCGLIAHVKDGEIISLKGNPAHPINQGHTCSKRARYLERVYSPDRVLRPMRRSTDNKWRPISWDDALDEIAQKIAMCCQTSGPESILYYQGFGIRTALQLLNHRFFNALGGVTTLRGTLCGGTGEASQNLDFGKRISHDPLDHSNAKSIILWGRNPVATQPPLVPIMNRMRKQGGELAVVDPIHTETAKIADRHVQPKPGSDLFLALAIASRILEQGWQNTAFVEQHTDNFDEFKQLVQKWPIDELLRAADVSADDLNYLVERLCKHSPTAILLGWGLHRWTHAHEAIRAIDALSAISGNIGISGGGVSQGFDEYAPYDMTIQNPQNRRQFLMPNIGEEILLASNPKIEMIFVTAGNPLNMAPDSQRVAEAFANTSFVVYCGQYMDDTAEASDLFLPVTTFLEEDDIVAGYGHDFVGPVNRIIPPRGEARSHFQIFSDLAMRLNIKDFNRNIDSWLSKIIAPLAANGISLEDIRHSPRRMGLPLVPYQDKVFPTPTGKFQMLSRIDTPLSSPNDVEEQWPFALLSTSPKEYLCSERLPRDHSRLPQVVLSDNAAAKLAINEGQQVTIKSVRGELKAELLIDANQRDDVAVVHRGGWKKFGHGINTLVESNVSEVGDGCAYYETRVRINP